MATITGGTRYSLKYVVSSPSNDETTLRTISGLNVGSGSGAGNGPVADSGITVFLQAFTPFSYGQVTNASWITEREVAL